MRRDPTRSASLRSHGRSLVAKRVHNLHQGLRQAIQDSDVAGLRGGETARTPFINWSEAASTKLMRAEDAIQSVIEQAMHPYDWTRDVITRSVEHGLLQAEAELKTSLDYIDPSEVSDLHASTAAIEARGIAAETERRILRLIAHALDAKQKPEDVMRETRLILEKITKLRLNMMVNTSVVRSVNAGKLLAYESEGINQVGVMPEWLPKKHSHVHDAPTRKAKVRQRVKANKAKRSRVKEPDDPLAELVDPLPVDPMSFDPLPDPTEPLPKLPEPVDVPVELTPEEEILKLFGGSPSMAEALAAVTEEFGQEPESTLVSILTAGDDFVCDDCDGIANDGPYDLDTARALIPAHPNAVLQGSTIASYGAMHEMVRAVFRGTAIRLRAGAKVITIGPNHPMLTRRGLKPARLIGEGDELLYDTRTDREAARRSGHAHFEQMPLVEDAFEAMLTASPHSRVTAAKHDLHGDAIFCEDEIDVVHPARPLLPILNSCGVEQLREGSLSGADPDLSLIPSVGARFFRGDTVDLASSGGVGCADTLIAADVFQWVPVLSIEHVLFNGLAFDASTSSSLYCSSGFVVSNCRCAFVPYGDDRYAPVEEN